MSKPSPGLGIDWRHKFAKGLVHSYPVNEGEGTYLKNYAMPQGRYDLGWLPDNITPPVWGTFSKVPGLHFPNGTSSPPTQAYGNTGGTNPNTTGANLLPATDFTRGLTIHLWMRPTDSLVGTVSSYAFVFLGEDNVARGTAMIGLIRGLDGVGGDCWKPTVTVYSNGSSSTNFQPGTATPWNAPSNGGIISTDSLPFEHVITIVPNGNVRWYSSDRLDQSVGNLTHGITPPDSTQYWLQIGIDDGLGLHRFEGDFWAVNIWNYVMGRESAFALMRNPLQMYKARSAGGGYGADVVPGGVDPPTDDGNTTPGSAGPTTGPDPDRFDGETPTPYSEEQFIYYGHHYEFLKDPLDGTRLDSYELDFNWARFKFIRRLWICGISTGVITLTITIDEVLKYTTTLSLTPASGAGWARSKLLLPPGLKGQLFRFIMTSPTSFKIFLDQSDIEWHPLSTDRGYQRFPLDLSAQHERGGTIA